MPTEEEIRERQRELWDSVVPAWLKWAERINKYSMPVTEAMAEALRLEPDSRVLDVACGTGEPGLTFAAKVPTGVVAATDLSLEMAEAANRLALEAGIPNYRAVVADASQLPFENASFDSVSCRFGIMFFPNPAAGVREMVRVLKPGGRIALSSWRSQDANPWITDVFEQVDQVLNLPDPPPDSPGMFRHSESGSLSALLEAAGLEEVEEKSVDVGMPMKFAQYWEMYREVAGGLAKALANCTDEERQAVEEKVLASLELKSIEGFYFARGSAWIASGTKRGGV